MFSKLNLILFAITSSIIINSNAQELNLQPAASKILYYGCKNSYVLYNPNNIKVDSVVSISTNPNYLYTNVIKDFSRPNAYFLIPEEIPGNYLEKTKMVLPNKDTLSLPKIKYPDKLLKNKAFISIYSNGKIINSDSFNIVETPFVRFNIDINKSPISTMNVYGFKIPRKDNQDNIVNIEIVKDPLFNHLCPNETDYKISEVIVCVVQNKKTVIGPLYFYENEINLKNVEKEILKSQYKEDLKLYISVEYVFRKDYRGFFEICTPESRSFAVPISLNNN